MDVPRLLFPDQAVDALAFTSNGEFFAFASGLAVSFVEMRTCMIIYSFQVPHGLTMLSLKFAQNAHGGDDHGTVTARHGDGHGLDDDASAIMDVEFSVPASIDPPAVIAPEEAANVSEQRWASGIQLLAAGPARTTVLTHTMHVVIMQFNRDQRAFDEVLLSSQLADRARANRIEIKPAWANGAKIFAAGVGAADISEARIELLPIHVVVYESDVPEIESIVDQLPSHSRPRLKPNAPIVAVPLQGDVSMLQDLTDNGSASDQTDHVGAAASSSTSGGQQAIPGMRKYPPGVKVKYTFLTYDEPEDECPKTSRSV